MADTSKVDAVLGSFREWTHPWKYIHATLEQQGLQRGELQLIEELWAEATDAKHWIEPSFQTSEQLIRQKLTVAYPWLSTSAVDALIRGASYVWK